MNYKKLNDIDFTVAWNEPDVRGWKIADEAGREFAKIDDIIIDEDESREKYLDVIVEQEHPEPNHMLVPVGVIDLQDENKKVIVNFYSKDQLLEMPKYDGKKITDEYEDHLMDEFAKNMKTTPSAETESTHEHKYYDNERLYDKRRRRDRDAGWETDPHVGKR